MGNNAKLTNPDFPALTQVDGHRYEAGQQTERGLEETIASMQTHIEMLRRVKQELGELKAENARLKAG